MSYGDYPDLSKVKKVLVVKLRHLGDCLLTTPVFSQLKKVLPNVLIDVLVYEEAKPILEGHPAISEILSIPLDRKKSGFFNRLYQDMNLYFQIAKGRYDLVINLTEGDRGILAALLSKAPIRVGFAPRGKWQKRCLTHIVKHTPGNRHTVERNLDALRRIGIFPALDERELYFDVPESAKIKMAQIVGDIPFILIHPTSRWRFKSWSKEKMRKLIEMILARGVSVVLTSGPDPREIEEVHLIAKDLPVKILAGQTDIKELGALMCLSKKLVCVDSVSLHIASALKIPTIVLFGPTSDINWGPWQNPYAKVLVENLPCRPCYLDGCGGSKRADCLESISESRVFDEIFKE